MILDGILGPEERFGGSKKHGKMNGEMGVSKNNGTPKWMVKKRENPIKMDDLGVPLFLETPKWIQMVEDVMDFSLFISAGRKSLLFERRK